MTIDRIEGQEAHCVWFDKRKLKRGVFPLVALVLTEAD
jgi:hypothetical protein